MSHISRPFISAASSSGDPPPAPNTSDRSFPFSQEQVYLCMKIVQEKDEEITVEDHIAALRKSIRPGPMPQPSNPLYVDTYDYWKHQHVKSQVKIKKLEDRIACLESRDLPNSIDDADQTSVHSQQHLYGGQGLPEQEIQVSVHCTRKRRAFEISEVQYPFLREENISLYSSSDKALHRLSGHIFRIGKQRMKLEAISQSSATVTEIDELANFTSDVLFTLDNTLSDCCHATSRIKVSDDNKQVIEVLKQTMDQIILTYLSCFRALDSMCQTILGRNKRGRIIYRLAKFFSKGLLLLHTLSTIQTEYEAAANQKNLRHKRARVGDFEYAANRHLSRVLATAVYNLDWKANILVHSEVLESILYVIIDQTSRLLSIALFDENVAASKHPGKITEASEEVVPTRKAELSRNETRYVIQVLYNALGGKEKRELFLQVIASGRTDRAVVGEVVGNLSESYVPTGNLLSKAKKLLQSTLLKTGFGHDAVETLKPLPVPEFAPLSVEDDMVENYGKDWFVEKVWDLLGWDLV